MISPEQRFWLPALAAASLGFAWGGRGCLVDQKCYADADCPGSEVCGRTGHCELQCRGDHDCELEYVCQKNRCVEPVECTLCAFPHAAAACVHGVCQRGSCDSGFYDVNGKSTDGCEYACTPSGPEICDRADNDCNGATDENTDLGTDRENCGRCDNVCPSPPHADPVCASGQCRYTCQAGFYENNGRAEDGCEGTTCVPSEEVCDGRDNDCDGGVDEGFDKTLVASCGPFCDVCSYAQAEARCAGGACEMGACAPGWYDADGLGLTGCEYGCTLTGDEQCDGIDNDCDGRVDEGDVCTKTCPADMVAVGLTYCIDRYEASRRDATATEQGQDDSIATSRPGVMPWMVNPMSSAHFATFQAACAAAGKRLCTREDWFAACTGPAQTPYVYGSAFDREACNCVDTFCDDYCADHAIEPAQCATTENCGYTYNCFHAMPTGQFARCTNEYGTLDINGNVWEVVPSDTDSRGYEIRGGAFNCASPSLRVTCSFNAGWVELYAGFRCCRDLP